MIQLVGGVCLADPHTVKEAPIIPRISHSEIDQFHLGDGKSKHGRGGMRSKLYAARDSGCPTIIADGTEPNVIMRLLNDYELLGTMVVPDETSNGKP